MNKQLNNLNWMKRTLGPGILFASTAIGVSHLVQSTRAGANYGFSLIIFIILANLFKYPFFEFGSRYANATQTSIIEGYKSLGKWVLWSYLIITIASMFFITSAVGAVTTGFLQNLLKTNEYGYWNHILIFCFCGTILSLGKYKYLDIIIKIIGITLLVSTICSFIIVLFKGPYQKDIFPLLEYSKKDVFFIIALMGWMPTAVDLSSWNSLWTIERIKQTRYLPSMKQTLFEFNMGYVISAILSICFLTLGTYLMYGTNLTFANNSATFANQVISLYTQSIGDWSYIIISVSGFSIMFGTCIAVFDGYARSASECLRLVLDKKEYEKTIYNCLIWLLVLGSTIIIFQFGSKIKELVDLATTISFLIAPFVAFGNYKLVLEPNLQTRDTPPKWLQYLALLGICFLVGFGFIFIVLKFI